MNERFAPKRVMNMIMFLLITVFYTLLLGIKESLWLDEWTCLVALDIIFFALFVFTLEHSRSRKLIAQNLETDYKRILIGYAISAGIAFGCSFFPEFVKPVILIPILMMALGTQGIAFVTGFYLCAVLGVATGMSSMELISCFCMLLFGCMLSEAMEDGKYVVWYNIIIACLSLMIPMLFAYLYHQEFTYELMIWGVAEGLGIDLLLFLFYKKLTVVRNTEIDTILADMQEEDYPLARELKSFSKKDFKHARRVARIAKRCARLVDADEQICGAAAFYYRIGILEGDQIAENGERIAVLNCFPEKVTAIIHEYHGILQKPTSIESAIVQMVDGLIKKLEVLDSTTMSSTWNQNMVIYQTLNEFSTDGMYDASGLSMNMFLKIREYLANERELL